MKRLIKRVLLSLLCIISIVHLSTAGLNNKTIFNSDEHIKYDTEDIHKAEITRESHIKGDTHAMTIICSSYIEKNYPEYLLFHTTFSPPACTFYVCIDDLTESEYGEKMWSISHAMENTRNYMADVLEDEGYNVSVYFCKERNTDLNSVLILARADHLMKRSTHSWR